MTDIEYEIRFVFELIVELLDTTPSNMISPDRPRSDMFVRIRCSYQDMLVVRDSFTLIIYV